MGSPSRVILDPKRAGEVITPVFDFIAKMNAFAVGETIGSVSSVTVSVWSGVDPNPGAMYSGTLTITPPSIVQPQISGGVPGVIYLIEIIAVVASRSLQLDGLLAVLPVGGM